MGMHQVQPALPQHGVSDRGRHMRSHALHSTKQLCPLLGSTWAGMRFGIQTNRPT